MLVKLTPVFIFTNIFKVSFTPCFLCQKVEKSHCRKKTLSKKDARKMLVKLSPSLWHFQGFLLLFFTNTLLRDFRQQGFTAKV